METLERPECTGTVDDYWSLSVVGVDRIAGQFRVPEDVFFQGSLPSNCPQTPSMPTSRSSDATGSAASSTNTPRSHEVTEFRAPTGVGRSSQRGSHQLASPNRCMAVGTSTVRRMNAPSTPPAARCYSRAAPCAQDAPKYPFHSVHDSFHGDGSHWPIASRSVTAISGGGRCSMAAPRKHALPTRPARLHWRNRQALRRSWA